jgi:hypothetical protein
MSVNISLIVLKKKIMVFLWFSWKFSWFWLISCYPDPFHWSGSGSGWPKWNGSIRIRIRNTVLVPFKKLREFTLLYCNLNWTSLVHKVPEQHGHVYLSHPQVQYTPDEMNYYAGPWDYVENLQSPWRTPHRSSSPSEKRGSESVTTCWGSQTPHSWFYVNLR